jgi:hypothetical protein
MRACLYQLLTKALAAQEVVGQPHVGVDMSVGGEMQQGVLLPPAACDWQAGVQGPGRRTLVEPGGGLVEEGVFVSGTGLPSWLEQHEDQHEGLEAQLEALLHCLGVAADRNPSRRQGALIRLLRAFREGRLGKFTLDDVAM